jgi:hypothetical protein
MSQHGIDVVWDPAKARRNRAKHGIAFEDASTVLLDPLALTVFDETHSDEEERWFTLGRTRQGTLLAVAHTYRNTGPHTAQVRIISARIATRRELSQYQHANQ